MDPSFNPPDYFKYSFGIIRNNIGNPDLKQERITIKLETGNWINSYLEKYPLHFTQKIQISNEETREGIIELDIEINQEFESFLLKYIDQMTITEPIYLQKQIMSKIQQSIKNYSVNEG